MIGLFGLFKVLSRGARSFLADEQSRSVGFVALSMILIGTIFYRRIEQLSWLDAAYFSTISLTTVGYGDFTPQTALGKVFTMVYVLAGIGVLVAFITEVSRHVIGLGKGAESES